MSRSNPPPSPIATRAKTISPANETTAAAPRPRRRALSVRFAALARWLHIYASMLGLAAVLFFSVTGITLNHPSWFGGGTELRIEDEGRVPPELLRSDAPGTVDGVAKLEVVELLRREHGVRGALADFSIDDYECMVAFKGPGYSADAFIDREDGRYTLSQNLQGFIGVINDLHKGRDSGPVWSVVIDVSAVVLTFISLSGLILIFYLKLRRVPGLALAVAGSALVGLLYWFGSP